MSDTVVKKLCLLSVVTITALAVTTAAQAPRPRADGGQLDRTEEVLRAEIQKLLRETGIPSISIALVDGDAIVWAAAFGEANVRANSAAGPETLYNTGSTFKTVTAVALMQLLERKSISPDSSIAQYLRGARVGDLSEERPVSFRQLLGHTSGLMGPSSGVPLWRRVALPTLADVAARLRVKRGPGTEFEYCNACYGLIGLLIERISGRPFPEYVTVEVLEPIGVRTPEPFEPTAEMAERIALPYSLWNNRPEPEGQIRLDVYPAGDVYLTAEDMARVVGALVNEGRFNGKRILDAATAREMRRQTPPAPEYGLGIELPEKGVETALMHTGQLPGYSAVYRGDVGSRAGVYVVANAGAVQPALDALSALALRLLRREEKIDPLPSFAKTETYTAVQVAEAILRRYAGTYQLTPSLFVDIVEERGRLLLQSEGGESFGLTPISENSFVVRALDVRLTFKVGADGKGESVTWHRGGRDTVAPKIK